MKGRSLSTYIAFAVGLTVVASFLLALVFVLAVVMVTP